MTGNGASAAVATDQLAPGPYTVKGGVKEGKAGKEGLKPWRDCRRTTTLYGEGV